MARYFAFVILIVSVLVAGCAQQQATEIRVLSYNIHHGEGMDGVTDLDRIAMIIREANPDIVALQEVDRGVKRTNGIDEPAVLAELTGMQAIFEKNIPYQGGEYGNAVLTRLPVEKYQNHHFPQTRPGEQRGMLEIHTRVGDTPFVFFATHLDYHGDDTERMKSMEMLGERLENFPDHLVIVAGDMNAKPPSRVMEKAREMLTDSYDDSEAPGYTYPADKPDRRIDYILHNGFPGLECTACVVLPEPVASDHRPLLAVFDLQK